MNRETILYIAVAASRWPPPALPAARSTPDTHVAPTTGRRVVTTR